MEAKERTESPTRSADLYPVNASQPSLTNSIVHFLSFLQR
jgi:hypothetical protein